MAGLGLAHGRSNTRRSAPDNCACKPLTRKSLDTTGLLMEGTESKSITRGASSFPLTEFSCIRLHESPRTRPEPQPRWPRKACLQEPRPQHAYPDRTVTRNFS